MKTYPRQNGGKNSRPGSTRKYGGAWSKRVVAEDHGTAVGSEIMKRALLWESTV